MVSSASPQALAQAGNLRAHMSATNPNLASAIKMAAAGSNSQAHAHQAFITAIQHQAVSQHGQQQRQNSNPVRLQTTAGGNLVAVVQQQQQQQQLHHHHHHHHQQQQHHHQQQAQHTGTSSSISSTSATISTGAGTQQLPVQTINVSGGSSISGEIMPQQTTVAGSGTAIHTVITPVVGQTVTNSPTAATISPNIAIATSPASSTTAQQVRTLVKKKIMQIRTEKE